MRVDRFNSIAPLTGNNVINEMTGQKVMYNKNVAYLLYKKKYKNRK
jgi:hypothetical protein